MTGGSGRNHTIASPNNRSSPIVPSLRTCSGAKGGATNRRDVAPKRTKYDLARPVTGLSPIKLSRITLSSSLPIRRELRHMNLTL
ncbi:hypothetical protein CHT98_29585 (plasmid) [Azospirillum brasilense]|uniref:Uncharacterized protein n=1 Tax=Azospirillum brasilense TaxID=192 RepID=A0A235H4J9_AZOBR|nr:hypothetical protein CHT98_29585 [Azospirillum brasilense]